MIPPITRRSENRFSSRIEISSYNDISNDVKNSEYEDREDSLYQEITPIVLNGQIVNSPVRKRPKNEQMMIIIGNSIKSDIFETQFNNIKISIQDQNHDNIKDLKVIIK